MELKNQIAELHSKLQKDIQRFAQRVLDSTTEDVEKTTRANFMRVIPEVPADDPFVEVHTSGTFYAGKDSIGKIITCGGNQVLFIEFGAGVSHSTETSTIVMDNNKQIEWASRPPGIVGIGEYGHHRGKDDFWVYKSNNHRIAIGDEIWRLGKNGETYIKTSGIRPVRALHRALGTTFRKLGSGRLKIK